MVVARDTARMSRLRGNRARLKEAFPGTAICLVLRDRRRRDR